MHVQCEMLFSSPVVVLVGVTTANSEETEEVDLSLLNWYMMNASIS